MNNYPAGAENDPNAPWNDLGTNKCVYCEKPTDNEEYCSKKCRFLDLDN